MVIAIASISYFIVSPFSFIFNAVVICKHVIKLIRCRDGRNTVSFVSTMLLLNLALADLLTGSYILWLRLLDYFAESFEHCFVSIAAVVASIEQSVNMLLLITSLRLYTTLKPFTRVRFKWWLLLVLWSWTLAGAVPLLMLSDSDLLTVHREEEFVFENWSCEWSFLVSPEQPTYQLALALLAYNTLAVVAIVIGYAVLLPLALAPRRSLGEASRIARGGGDSTLKIRVLIVVMTDVACWIPIIAIALVNLSSPVSEEVRIMVDTLFIPVNCLVNPIIYSKMDKLIKKCCCCCCCRHEEGHVHTVHQSAANLDMPTP